MAAGGGGGWPACWTRWTRCSRSSPPSGGGCLRSGPRCWRWGRYPRQGTHEGCVHFRFLFGEGRRGCGGWGGRRRVCGSGGGTPYKRGAAGVVEVSPGREDVASRRCTVPPTPAAPLSLSSPLLDAALLLVGSRHPLPLRRGWASAQVGLCCITQVSFVCHCSGASCSPPLRWVSLPTA